jgi:pyruvate carboxylase
LSARRPTPCAALGNKVSARNLAIEAGVPVMPATDPLPDDMAEVKKLAAEGIGYPVMLKASWGGGGRGMRVIARRKDLQREVPIAKREARSAFGKDEVYLEKLVERARHVEARSSATPMAICASVRARLLGPAPQPEGRRARARPLS